MNPFGPLAFFSVAAMGLSSAAALPEKEDPCAGVSVEKVEGPMVWRPGPDGVQSPLWPEGMPLEAPETGGKPEWTGNGSPLVAGRTWNFATYVSQPTMTIFAPKVANTGAAMLVLPGGGYAAVAMDLEGTEICDWITDHGVTCIVLKYRTPQRWVRDKNGVAQPPKPLLALQDAQRAMGLLRRRASTYNIDPDKIGVIGFSAGAHLAAMLSNAEARAYDPVDDADAVSSRPDFAVLLYPGRHWDSSQPKNTLALAPWMTISAAAPPTLLIHAMNDPSNDVRHSIAYGLALSDAGVPVDMRFFATGCHAFGLRPTSEPITTEWPGHAVKWLQNIKILGS